MSEHLGPWVIEGPLGYRTAYGWSNQRRMALSFDDEMSARDWIHATRPRIGIPRNVPFNHEAEAIERHALNIPTPVMPRQPTDYDPHNDGPG